MHSKKKGNIGQFATGFFLAKAGYSVFTEEGDISQVDLIAELDGNLKRFQCKAVTPKDGSLLIPLRKSGPGYSKKYRKVVFDYFAAYDLVNHKLYFVSSSVLDQHNSSFILRLSASKNGQKKKLHLAEDYLAEKIIDTF